MDINNVHRIKVEKYLQRQHKILRLRAIERELGFPRGTIQKFTYEQRKLDDKRITALYHYFKKNRFK
ncbi:hypothetical protein NBT05_03185 [Aquimarina sp. ERC-38]|uniref:hypothetical protein n=1 Tax=Aquimarina sp. ERC-38 TaxID=2949996 RepID=UPI002246DDE9|nr:hypothetical protein [Aquimarina sp. ERC-38]UZO81485.1 hypothetical protein NBT05_03185 [Aquimarina sp. ERC-38]